MGTAVYRDPALRYTPVVPASSAPARPFSITKVASVEADASGSSTFVTFRNSLVQASGVSVHRT